MATNTSQQDLNVQDTQFYVASEDEESIASLETDDGIDHLPEKVLAQVSHIGHDWYLVKWQDCPILRSSWEGTDLFADYPQILETWLIEKQNQIDGKSKPLDLAAFNQAVLDLEIAERGRRKLRRLKRQINRIISIVDT